MDLAAAASGCQAAFRPQIEGFLIEFIGNWFQWSMGNWPNFQLTDKIQKTNLSQVKI